MMRQTQTLTPRVVEERWFVYDPENNLQIFTTEATASEEFQKQIDLYRDEAIGDEWNDEVECITWGKVYQTVALVELEIPPDADPEDFEGVDDICEAFAIEHRLCHDLLIRDDMRRYLYRNVACEYRKSLADFSKMPNLSGWT